MHSVLWASILASAGVALLTTLLVEYLAKPGLEARKERILEGRRQQRSTLKSVQRCAFLAGKVYVLGKMEAGEYKENIASTLSGKAQRIAAEIEGLASSTYEVMNVPTWMDDEWRKSTAIVAGFSIGFSTEGWAPEHVWEEFDNAAGRMDEIATLLTTSNWHLWRKHKLAKIIKSSPLHIATLDKIRKENNSLPD
jgi:hypothetical protein